MIRCYTEGLFVTVPWTLQKTKKNKSRKPFMADPTQPPQLKHRKSRSLPQAKSIQELQSLISEEGGPEFVKRLQQRGSINYSSFRVSPDRLVQAATYIEDAIKARKPQKRITEKGAIRWLTPLKLIKCTFYMHTVHNIT